jgi:hypothetical protein
MDTHYVILRDDDTNALTPAECLDRLYRPFLRLGLPVNLSVIPEVGVNATRPDGGREGFLPATANGRTGTVPLCENTELVAYIQKNTGYQVAQHGCHHDCHEFELNDRAEIRRRLDQGARRLAEAGFAPVPAFVAPHDRFSRRSLAEVARRFRVVSAGWFESGRLPLGWWPRYLAARLTRTPHWRAGSALLLSHPGCLLSRFHRREGMLERVQATVRSRRLTVLVTHWWEYFEDGRADEGLVKILHETAAWLAEQRDVQVITFGDLAEGRVALKSVPAEAGNGSSANL